MHPGLIMKSFSIDPGQRRGVGPDRRREPLPHLLVDRAADGAPGTHHVFILSFQASWNELGHFIISTQSTSLDTLTKGVAQLASGQLGSGNRYPLKLAASMLMTIPVAVLFFVFQRRIMNASSGAVKE